MRFELDAFRDQVEQVPPSTDTQATRREIRETTDALIHDALLVNDLPELVRLSAESIGAVARALLRYNREPQVPDFVEAAKALLETSRSVIDKTLLLRQWDEFAYASVMVEIVVRGVCASLSIPYDEVLREVAAARKEERNADVRGILVRAGLIKGDGDAPQAKEAEVEPLGLPDVQAAQAPVLDLGEALPEAGGLR
jgi:hypothetical protein